jgi:hypothetical protein
MKSAAVQFRYLPDRDGLKLCLPGKTTALGHITRVTVSTGTPWPGRPCNQAFADEMARWLNFNAARACADTRASR